MTLGDLFFVGTVLEMGGFFLRGGGFSFWVGGWGRAKLCFFLFLVGGGSGECFSFCLGADVFFFFVWCIR